MWQTCSYQGNSFRSNKEPIDNAQCGAHFNPNLWSLFPSCSLQLYKSDVRGLNFALIYTRAASSSMYLKAGVGKQMLAPAKLLNLGLPVNVENVQCASLSLGKITPTVN